MNHRISQEPDRIAHQATKNIITLSRYRSKREQLETMQSRLAEAMVKRHQTAPVRLLAEAIASGQNKLEKGCTFLDALNHSEQLLEQEPA